MEISEDEHQMCIITLLIICLGWSAKLYAVEAIVTNASDAQVGTYSSLSASLSALPGSPTGTPSPYRRAPSPNPVLRLPEGSVSSVLAPAARPSNPPYAPQPWHLSAGSLVAAARSNSMTGSGHAQTIQGFTLDGDSWRALGGLLVDNRSGVTINDVSAKHFNWGGIWLHRVKNTTLTGGKITDSSWTNSDYGSGNLNIGKAENVTVDGVRIDAHRSGSGYGIKALPLRKR